MICLALFGFDLSLCQFFAPFSQWTSLLTFPFSVWRSYTMLCGASLYCFSLRHYHTDCVVPFSCCHSVAPIVICK